MPFSGSMTSDDARSRMVELQLAGRGISDPRVLDAFQAVPREAFIPPGLAEFAYEDAPLPIGEDQTISQPYIVAVTIEALRLKATSACSRSAPAPATPPPCSSRIAKEVFTVERRESLANEARERLARLGYRNVHVLHGDGTLGWPEHAPYDAIAVAAGGPEVPKALLDQLAPGGRLVIPVGPDESSQVLTRVTRVGADEFREEPLIEVRFVPLIGEQGWPEEERVLLAPGKSSRNATVAKLIRETAEPIDDIESCSVDALLERIGDARLVLLGEATHGTSEFYRMRARITKALIERRGFDFVAVEADWPDAARVDDYVLGDRPRSKLAFTPFSRFPTWMWRNEEVARLRRLAATSEPGPGRARRPRRVPRPRSLQPVHLDRGRPRLPRRRRPGGRPRRARPLRRADAVAEGSRRLRPSGARRPLRELRDRGRRHAARHARRDGSTTPARTASDSSTPRRTRAWWRTPSATTAPCTTARRRPGTCATRTCSTRCRRCWRSTAPTRRGSSGSTTRTSATPARPR